MIQLSRDDPAVNKKLEADFDKFQIEKCGRQVKLNIGPCTIHPCHTAFMKGMKELKTDISNILVCLHSLFKLSTKRRELYEDLCDTLQQDIEFFLRFVVTRWLSCLKAVTRLINHFDTLATFVHEYLPEHDKQIGRKSIVFQKLQNFFSDENKDANLCRLLFVQFLASKHEPYNKRFQTDSPVVCYLYEESRLMLQNILGIVCKDDLPRSSKHIFKLGITKFHIESKRSQPNLGATLMNKISQLPKAVQKNIMQNI